MNKTKSLLVLILLNLTLFTCSSDDNSEMEEPRPVETNKLVKTEKINDNFKSDYSYNTENSNIIATIVYAYDSENYPTNVNADYSGNSFQFDIEYYDLPTQYTT